MIDVNIQAVPNQSLSILLDGAQYSIAIREANGIMSATVIRDSIVLIDNVRLVSGTPVLPYDYLESGNFVLTTEAFALPEFSQFGVTQFLLYLTADEVAELRAAA